MTRRPGRPVVKATDIPWGTGITDPLKQALRDIVRECRASHGADGQLPDDAAETIWRLRDTLHAEADKQVIGKLWEDYGKTREHQHTRLRASKRAARALDQHPAVLTQIADERTAWNAVDTTGRRGVGRRTGPWRAACLSELAYLWKEGPFHFDPTDVRDAWTPTPTPDACFGRVGVWLLNLPRLEVATAISEQIAVAFPVHLQARIMAALRPAHVPQIDELRPNELQDAIDRATRRPHGQFDNSAQAAASELTPSRIKRARKQAVARRQVGTRPIRFAPAPPMAKPEAAPSLWKAEVPYPGWDPAEVTTEVTTEPPDPDEYVAIQLPDGRWVDIQTGAEIDEADLPRHKPDSDA